MKAKLHFYSLRKPRSHYLVYREARGDKGGPIIGTVGLDPLNGTWANSKSVRVFKTRAEAARALI